MSGQKRAKLFSFKYFVMDFIRVSGALPGLLWLRPKIRYTSKAAKKRIRVISDREMQRTVITSRMTADWTRCFMTDHSL